MLHVVKYYDDRKRSKILLVLMCVNPLSFIYTLFCKKCAYVHTHVHVLSHTQYRLNTDLKDKVTSNRILCSNSDCYWLSGFKGTVLIFSTTRWINFLTSFYTWLYLSLFIFFLYCDYLFFTLELICSSGLKPNNNYQSMCIFKKYLGSVLGSSLSCGRVI
jgi:hypothetical protein